MFEWKPKMSPKIVCTIILNDLVNSRVSPDEQKQI